MVEIPDYLAYAAELRIDAQAAVADERWQTVLTEFFTRLGETFKGEAGVTIGHIKGFLRLASGDCAYLSTVGTSTGASCRFEKKDQPEDESAEHKSNQPAISDHGDLDFNVILFGLAEDRVVELIQPAVVRLAEDLQATVQLTKAAPKTKGGFIKK